MKCHEFKTAISKAAPFSRRRFAFLYLRKIGHFHGCRLCQSNVLPQRLAEGLYEPQAAIRLPARGGHSRSRTRPLNGITGIQSKNQSRQ